MSTKNTKNLARHVLQNLSLPLADVDGRLARYALLKALSTSERYILSYLTKRSRLGSLLIADVDASVKLLLDLNLIRETTDPAVAKTRSFTLTTLGNELNGMALTDLIQRIRECFEEDRENAGSD